jgi:ribonuclease-3
VEVARHLNLGSHLKLGKGEQAGGGRERPSIQADAVEAILAAVYLDGGIGQVRKLIHSLILDREQEKAAASRDYKTALQELVQRESGKTLFYHMVGESGPDHAKVFSMAVQLNGETIGIGRGKSKKEAEQVAAKAAVQLLEGEEH